MPNLPDMSNITLNLTINGFECSEIMGSGACVIDGAGSTAHRMFHVKYSEAGAFALSFLPSAAIVNGQIQFTEGAKFPGYTGLIAVRARFEGLGAIYPTGPSNSINYPLAQVTIEYASNNSTLNLGSGNMPIIRKEYCTVSGEVLELPKNSFKFVLDNQPIEQALGLIMPHADYKITEENVPTEKFSIATFLTMLGKANSVIFLNAIPVGTVIYLGTTIEPQSQPGVALGNAPPAVILWTLTHEFKVRRERWDYVYRPGVGWAQITPTPYPLADINSVLQVLT